MRDVVSELQWRIVQQEAITFSEFMRVALYWPMGGYYTSHRRVGSKADFITAPVAHPLFGALLSLQLQQLWEFLGQPSPFWVVEVGAGTGILGRDVLAYTPHLNSGLGKALRYVLIDLLPTSGVERDLPQSRDTQVHRLCTGELPLQPLEGCFLANELLDSLPVHRVTVQEGRLQEIYVTMGRDGSFQEVTGEPSTPALAERFRKLGITLPEGYRAEVNLSLEPWMTALAEALRRGFLLLIDYGHPVDTLYNGERARGTLRCYRKHTLNSNPYEHVGEQDISVHVDFTSVVEKGRNVGFHYLGSTSQRQFLHNLGFLGFLQALTRLPMEQAERDANRRGMLELVRPEGMGEFQVLGFSKGVDASDLYGFTSNNPLRRRVEAHPHEVEVPLSIGYHLAFPSGPSPWMELPWQELWQ